jgi:transcription initiation factor TFIID subunit 9B
MNDVRLAIQAKVEQGMSTTWPKEVSLPCGGPFLGQPLPQFLLSLAASVNKEPLPAVPESYGVRLPPEADRLTAPNFDLVPKLRPQRHQAMNGDQSMDAEGEDVDAGLFGDDDDEDEEMEDNPPQSATSVPSRS